MFDIACLSSVFLKVNKLYLIAFIFITMLSSATANDMTATPEEITYPDHVLSGYLVDGGLWELKVYCYSSSVFGESLHGILRLNGVEPEEVKIGSLLTATLGELEYFGGKGKDHKIVTGWYFSDWPQTCSFLPK